MKIFVRLIIILIMLTVLLAVEKYILFPYNINSKGVIQPLKEWRLLRLPDGSILNTEKNNLTNNLTNYSVLEFQRGDHGEFMTNEIVFSHKTINKNDTVGFIRSFEEERRLLELTSGLEEQKKLLQIYLSGEREAEINAARERLKLAETEYETQKRLVARMESLHGNGVIADEEWEIALNEYLVKQQNISIAQSALDILFSGAKPEEIDLVRTNILSYEQQILQTKNRIGAFNIKAPFSGTIIRQQGPELDGETIIRVADTDNLLVSFPVDYYQLAYIDNGSRVNLRINSGRTIYNANVLYIDNTVQIFNQKQNVFITAAIEDFSEKLLPNMLVQTEVVCEPVSAWNYIKRMFKVIFEN